MLSNLEDNGCMFECASILRCDTLCIERCNIITLCAAACVILQSVWTIKYAHITQLLQKLKIKNNDVGITLCRSQFRKNVIIKKSFMSSYVRNSLWAFLECWKIWNVRVHNVYIDYYEYSNSSSNWKTRGETIVINCNARMGCFYHKL